MTEQTSKRCPSIQQADQSRVPPSALAASRLLLLRLVVLSSPQISPFQHVVNLEGTVAVVRSVVWDEELQRALRDLLQQRMIKDEERVAHPPQNLCINDHPALVLALLPSTNAPLAPGHLLVVIEIEIEIAHARRVATRAIIARVTRDRDHREGIALEVDHRVVSVKRSVF